MFDDQKISIILPIKNGDKDELTRAINSIYAQEHENFELLLIDDGSEAGFAAVLDEVALMDERIKLHHISPSGVSGAGLGCGFGSSGMSCGNFTHPLGSPSSRTHSATAWSSG